MSSIGRSMRRCGRGRTMPSKSPRRGYVVELMPLAMAMADARRGSALVGWLDELAAVASGPRRECILCCRHLDERPASVVMVEPLNQGQTVWVGPVCATCAPTADRTDQVAAAVERELGLPAHGWRQASAPGLA